MGRARPWEVDMSGELKKEEFRKYLEWSGVIDALTKRSPIKRTSSRRGTRARRLAPRRAEFMEETGVAQH